MPTSTDNPLGGHRIDPRTLPVTAQDEQNNFVYANDSYLELCGFDWQEIEGEPGTMMQHPSLPVQVRDDINKSLGAGEPWTGIVRNVRKDGNFYWARACLAPMIRGGRVRGRLMVRTAPTDEEIALAAQAYERMQRNPRSGWGIFAGRIGRTNAVARAVMRVRGDLRLQLTAAMAAFDVATLAALWLVPGTSAEQLGWVAGVIGAFSVAGLAVAHRLLVEPLNALLEAAHHMAGGDLGVDVTLPGQNELARLAVALNQTRLTLKATAGDIRAAAQDFDAAAATVSRASSELSARAESQAANLEQTAASLDVLVRTVRRNANMAQRVRTIADDAASTSEAGGRQMTDVCTQMAQIATASREIEELISSIREIAAKTNILALNAAVEAARAGVHGAGFAVVASEVRTLAQKTDAIAKEANTLVTGSGGAIRAGATLVDACAQTMQTLSASVRDLNTCVADISRASVEQSEQLDQINSAVADSDRMTQQNAAMIDSIHSAAARLSEKALTLRGAVSLLDAGE